MRWRRETVTWLDKGGEGRGHLTPGFLSWNIPITPTLEPHLPRPYWRRRQDRSGGGTLEIGCSHLDSLEESRGDF